jgi:hypothetical protein
MTDSGPAPFTCNTCGVQHAASDRPPSHCSICEDERQYVGPQGQTWTTSAELRAHHRADVRLEEHHLTGIGTEPQFAIGQRALLVETPEGNVLWDCVPLLDEEIDEFIRSKGGLAAIAISHPHFYAAMVDYAHAFDAPVYLHAADRASVMRDDARLVFWEGDVHRLPGGITLLRLGGHFEGATVLHWPDGSLGAGVLLSGDVVHVVQDRRWVSFMRSYPNLIPLSAETIGRIVSRLEPYDFERIYGGWFGAVVASDAKGAVRRSAARYITAVTGGSSPR